jgi:hypothetical protein
MNYYFGIFFLYYILVHSELFDGLRKNIFKKLHEKIVFAINCAFCFAFHVTLVVWLFTPLPFFYVYTAPVVNLFLNLFLKKLSNDN